METAVLQALETTVRRTMPDSLDETGRTAAA
jgi:hypothetical protein